MPLCDGKVNSRQRLRQTAQAGVAACLLALTLLACGLVVHTVYEALRHDTATAVKLMSLDDVAQTPLGSGATKATPALAQAPVLALTPPSATLARTPLKAPAVVALPATPQIRPPRPGRLVRPMFNDRPIHKVGTVTMLVTAYSPDAKSCGPHARGITASGYSVWTNAMMLAAADARLLPFGVLVSLPGYNAGRPVPVLDRGSKIKGRHIDVLFPTDAQATAWGKKYLTITVWEYD